MTVYGNGRNSGDPDRGSNGGKTFATAATIVVAFLGLLSSPAWGPPICQAVRICAAGDSTSASTPDVPAAASAGTNEVGTPTAGAIPTTVPTTRAKGTGYPSRAGDYCDEFVRAWQDGYRDRVTDLSNAQVAGTVFTLIPPAHYRNDWGPTGTGAQCTIVDIDRGNAQVIRLSVTKPTGAPGAITAVTA